MSSNLETVVQKLNWSESEYRFDLRMDPKLYITVLQVLKKKVHSCALSLISNNKLYVIPLNTYPIKNLEEKVFPAGKVEVEELKNACLDCIEKVREKDIKDMDFFHEKYGGFQKNREIYNRTFVADSMGMIHNFKIALLEFFSFGNYSRKLQLYLDNITEKAIAWLVLEQTTKNCADNPSEYAKHKKQINHEEFVKQIDNISGFYRNLSYHAHFGGERMRDYQDEVFDVYSLDLNELKLRDIEGIKKNILGKIIKIKKNKKIKLNLFRFFFFFF